jgi:hypothetical protein
MTTMKYESRSNTMAVTHDDDGKLEYTLAWFGFCLVQHQHRKVHDLVVQHTTLSTPSTYRLHEVTTHPVNGGAVITLTDGDNFVSVNLTGISPESLCDGISVAQLQEITE